MMLPKTDIIQIETTVVFDQYADRLAEVMTMFGDRWEKSLGESLENLRESLPHVWLGTDVLSGDLVCAASLSDEAPGQQAFLHGLHDPRCKNHPAIGATAMAVMNYAFETLGVLKLMAECCPRHWGARGFCRRFGFKQVSLRDDRVVYELVKENYHLLTGE